MIITPNTKAWLRFDNSAIEDTVGLTWTVAKGTPVVGTTNAYNDKALQADGTIGICSSAIQLGGQDFTIDGWFYIDESNVENARLFNVINPTTGNMMVTIRVTSNSDKRLQLWYNNSPTQSGSTGYNYNCTAGNYYKNKLIHVALTYQHKESGASGATFRVYIDGVQRAVNGTAATYIPRGTFNVEIGYNSKNAAQNFIGPIDEFRITDGERLWTDNFTPPTPAYYQNIQRQINFDTLLKIRNPLFEWRYENPGDANQLVGVTGTTVSSNAPRETQSGVMYYQSTRTSSGGTFGLAATKELWCRCDVYFDDSYASGNKLRIYSGDANGVCGLSSHDTPTEKYAFWVNGTNIGSGNSYFVKNRLYSILLHMVSDSTNGLIEARIIQKWGTQGEIIYDDSFSWTGNVNNGDSFGNFYIQMDGTHIYASNIIISNASVDINEGWVKNRADTRLEIETSAASIFNFDTYLNIYRSTVVDSDTHLNICRGVTPKFDTAIELQRSEQVNFDTELKTPYVVSDNDSNIQNVSISLQEQQLTDNVSFTHVGGDAVIMGAVDMQFLDYITKGRIEETSTRGILQTCKCTCDIDEILYQQMAYAVPEESWEWTPEYDEAVDDYNATHEDEVSKVPSAPASAHIRSIANSLGKNVSLLFDDYISTMSTEVQSGTNYAGLISELFGWTSRLPQRMINCYLRGDTIYVVQRGKEQHTVVLDNLKLTVHTITKKIVRTTWGSDPKNQTEVKPLYDSWVSSELTPFPPEQEEPLPGDGVSLDDEGLVQKTTVEHGSEVVETTYEYEDMGGGKKFLYKETAVTYSNGTKVDEVVTIHNPVSYGQSQITSYDTDSVLGSVVSPSDFDDRITPYDYQGMMSGSGSGGYKEGWLGGYDSNGHYYPYVYDAGGNRYLLTGFSTQKKKIGEYTHTIPGNALIDTSFPVDGDALLEELTDDIRWLDRKTEESVTLELYDYNHVIDFNDKISWHGNIYYLRSNSIMITESIRNKQTLEFVRWY